MESVEYYMSLPYTRLLRRDEDGDIVARIEELPGCVAHGENDEEALTNLADVQRGWIEARLAADLRIPEPEQQPILSGKWVQRTTRSLHRELTLLAQKEGVSLNHLVSVVLSRAAEILQASGLEMLRQPPSRHTADIWMEASDRWNIQRGNQSLHLGATLETVRRIAADTEKKFGEQDDEKAHRVHR